MMAAALSCGRLYPAHTSEDFGSLVSVFVVTVHSRDTEYRGQRSHFDQEPGLINIPSFMYVV